MRHTPLLALTALLACEREKDASPADSPGTDDTGPAPTGCGDELALEEGQVRTSTGVFEGVPAGEVTAFLGLPFATPPVGDLRFRPPEPAPCAPELVVADAFAPMCIQRDLDGSIIGEEDCLALNVWMPAALPDPDESLPVLFFVHGGANVQGGTSTGDEDLLYYEGATLAARTGAVVVTTAYRLGALGFLAHPALSEEAGVSGNYGLRDQVLALQWVQGEISRFGGDPARVLLFGESAGAVDTCALYTSPAADGLFSAALMQSGGCSAPTLAAREAEGESAVEEAGCAEAEDPVACLRALDAETLAGLSGDVISDLGVPSGGGFGPAVDGDLLPQDPMAALEDGAQHDVPFVVGSNAHETSPWVATMSEDDYTTLVESLFGRLSDEVLALYPADSYTSPRWAWIALTTDASFTCPARRIARAAAASQTSPVWRYWFSLVPDSYTGTAYGAFHGLELTYLFQHLDAVAESTGYEPTAEDEAVEAALGGAWFNLAADGDPGAALDWPTYDPESDPYLEFGAVIAAGDGIQTEACDFWDELAARLVSG